MSENRPGLGNSQVKWIVLAALLETQAIKLHLTPHLNWNMEYLLIILSENEIQRDLTFAPVVEYKTLLKLGSTEAWIELSMEQHDVSLHRVSCVTQKLCDINKDVTNGNAGAPVA